ncbi:copper-binding protein [uncultured Hydrogenophaga sp.]|uniref:copper-binding protein n=1 Tax=uncultured Hydrogenophaga sp. TaxID=199683 RepID=UPI00265F8F39|nr:copper-binding protein [uncultured Hydrogenophaga sp.]
MTLPLKPPLVACALALAAGLALAQHSGHSHGASPAQPAAAAPASGALPWAEAEVRRVDADAGAVTLRHGDIRNLDMPPMTMVFKARDPAMLSGIKAGEKVRFTADQINGTYTVLSIEPLR